MELKKPKLYLGIEFTFDEFGIWMHVHHYIEKFVTKIWHNWLFNKLLSNESRPSVEEGHACPSCQSKIVEVNCR